MSDEDRYLDVDIDGDENGDGSSSIDQADKRAHHNALERKRRDHIKDCFYSLRDSVPNLQGEKASRAQILNKATDFIQHMKKKSKGYQVDIDDITKENVLLESQVKTLEKARNNLADSSASGRIDDSITSNTGSTRTTRNHGKRDSHQYENNNDDKNDTPIKKIKAD